MLKGNLIDIKHLAVHDGPGVRTTIFFKGCPLRCAWCHNPESQSAKPELGFLQNRCINCQRCVSVCRLHSFSKDGKHLIDRTQCIACGRCVNACPVNALELYGTAVPLEKMVSEVVSDEPFYRADGGGCTVSGGEPLLQSDVVAELFAELKKFNIHTAVDSCAAVSWSAFEKVLPLTDLFLIDLKHPESLEHKRMTGLGNEQILENLQKLNDTGKPIEIRIPLIPGYNDTDAALEGFVQILKTLKNLIAVAVLPFHRARFKYQALDQVEPLKDMEPCSEENAARVREYFIKNDIKVSE